MHKKLPLFSLLSLCVVLTASCASHRNETLQDPYESHDRFETFNRAVFAFNYKLDKYVIKPVAKGYRKITNQFFRDRVNNALFNILEPMSAANQLLQGEFKQSATTLGRFAVNSTLGLAGTFDVAGEWGWKKDLSGFDSTLAKWCVPDGPFIVLPIIGPSTPRAAGSLIVDGYSTPVYWLGNHDANTKDKIFWGYAAVTYVAIREKALDIMDDLERNSVDYYSTMRSAYMQLRRQKNNTCINSSAADAELNYDFDFGIEEEDEVFDNNVPSPVLPQHTAVVPMIDSSEIK